MEAGWAILRQMTGIICDKRMHIMLKAVGNSYTQTKLRKIQQKKDGEMAKL